MTQFPLIVAVDSRLLLPRGAPRDLAAALRKEFTYANPDFYRKKSLGLSTWGCPPKVSTHGTDPDGRLTLPRGGIGRLRRLASDHDIKLRFLDRTTTYEAEWPEFHVDPGDHGKYLRWYQQQAVEQVLEKYQGIIRAPTGSGKTLAALALLPEVGQRALVIARDKNLLEQWRRVAVKSLGLDPREVGVIMGGKYKPGPLLTLALQQSLYAKKSKLPLLLEEHPFGIVVVDEVQTVAARTFHEVVDKLPARYRVGFSADETRKDRKEFLIYDEMGPVIHETSRDDLERQGVVEEVLVRVVPTDFEAPWYRDAEGAERDFNRLLDEMTTDHVRNELVLRLVEEVVSEGETPILIFTHRREHAAYLSDARLSVERAVPCGLLLGGDGADRERFQEDLAKIESGRLAAAAGTFKSIGVGIDMPSIRAGVVTTPISAGNRQYFNQVRGRLCRSASGKRGATLYYVWDREVFPTQVRRMRGWGDFRMEMRDGSGQWAEV